jgi:hypothetical protein
MASRLSKLGETPESDAEFNYPAVHEQQFAPYRPDFQFGFEPQQYASELPMAMPYPADATQFTAPRVPFQLPTAGLRVPVPLGRLGEVELRGDYTRNPYGAPDFSLGFGFTRKF